MFSVGVMEIPIAIGERKIETAGGGDNHYFLNRYLRTMT